MHRYQIQGLHYRPTGTEILKETGSYEPVQHIILLTTRSSLCESIRKGGHS